MMMGPLKWVNDPYTPFKVMQISKFQGAFQNFNGPFAKFDGPKNP